LTIFLATVDGGDDMSRLSARSMTACIRTDRSS